MSTEAVAEATGFCASEPEITRLDDHQEICRSGRAGKHTQLQDDRYGLFSVS